MMRVLHLLRKPCSERSVTANVLKHGTAGLNIEASVSAGGDPEAIRLAGMLHCDRDTAEIASRVAQQGRWPANLILQHLDGCVQDGTKKVGSGKFVSHDGVVRSSPMMSPEKGWNGNNLNNSKKNAPNQYGTETVAAWVCAEGCPVAALDRQSGVTKSTGGRIGNAKGAYTTLGSTGFTTSHQAGDPGEGASRYYMQFGGGKRDA